MAVFWNKYYSLRSLIVNKAASQRGGSVLERATCGGLAPRRILFATRKDGTHVQVLVRDNNVDQALKALKKKMQREGIFREMKLRGHYEKPTERRAREKAEAIRRARKLARKREIGRAHV